MKKLLVLALIGVVLTAISGCGGDSGSGSSRGSGAEAPPVSMEEAKTAFIVGFVAVFSASIGLAFGQEVPGASLDPETEAMTLENLSLAELTSEEVDFPYSSISGTATPEGEDNMLADLTLEGGPVETLQFTLTSAQMQSESGFDITVVANGREMDLQVTPEDMQG